MTPAKTPPLAVALNAAVLDDDTDQDADAEHPLRTRVLTTVGGAEPRAEVDAPGLHVGRLRRARGR